MAASSRNLWSLSTCICERSIGNSPSTICNSINIRCIHCAELTSIHLDILWKSGSSQPRYSILCFSLCSERSFNKQYCAVCRYIILSVPRCKTFLSPPLLNVLRNAFFALSSGELGLARVFPLRFLSVSLLPGTLNKSCALRDWIIE